MNTAIETNTVNHPVVSRDRWIAERKALLAREKELTHLRDQIARERRALPWVRIEKRLRLRHARGPAHARRSVRRPPPAAGAALHVRPGLGAGLPELLVHGRPQRRHERAPGASRRHAASRSRARRWPRSSAFASAWAGSSSGCLRSAATSTTTSTSASRRRSGPKARSTTTTACSPSRARKLRASACSTRTTRARSSTPTRPTGAAWR